MKLLLGIVLITLGIVIHNFYYGRLILILMGVGYLVAGVCRKYRKNKYRKYTTVSLLFLLGMFILDTILVLTINIEPIFSLYNNSESVKIYNGLGYRVWKCNETKDLVVDYLYQKPYQCPVKQISTIEINAFASQIVENYNSYEDKFVKISGKISKINGLNDFEMQAYENQEDPTNGYVTFADNVTLRFVFNDTEEKLTNYELYDRIVVIGRISSIATKNDNTLVKMTDSRIINDDLYQDYQVLLSSEKLLLSEPSLIYASAKLNVYNNFSTSVMIKYSNQDVYDLEYVLSSAKLNLEQILNKANDIQENYEQDIKVYLYSNFKIYLWTKNNRQNILITNLNSDFKDIDSIVR